LLATGVAAAGLLAMDSTCAHGLLDRATQRPLSET
jgi:hypothetical protein